LEAGYQLLHIDPTVDRTLPRGQPPSVETVVARTVDMIGYAESERRRLNLPPIAYEVGTDEVHGGLVDLSSFKAFLQGLRDGLAEHGLSNAWPSFIVAQVGTDLHTTSFDTSAARRLYDIVSPLGSLIKGHYTDFVENPWAYPETGMGGANLGPEFTAMEYWALRDLCAKEQTLCGNRPGLDASHFLQVLLQAVVDSQRWKKWLQPDEMGKDFADLSAERQAWLVETGARYIWTESAVLVARQKLYDNLALVMPDPSAHVVERIALAMDKYVRAFNLFDARTVLEKN
jgi:D-tagatose-1,6-bisphosphate aldolase subunit GatZ/KbaZ